VGGRNIVCPEASRDSHDIKINPQCCFGMMKGLYMDGSMDFLWRNTTTRRFAVANTYLKAIEIVKISMCFMLNTCLKLFTDYKYVSHIIEM